ncbi:hypothetical protein AVEN_87768-1 [Araneus ventricosus]|uniref:Uncharacterized protein n=1 Tax=Araneus ventricosus TaxID=182803 RepID=A0A4Y2VE84_ARAVE|nr:hypothetical protein AVEN_87768-1 [Araneus ventricosus]
MLPDAIPFNCRGFSQQMQGIYKVSEELTHRPSSPQGSLYLATVLQCFWSTYKSFLTPFHGPDAESLINIDPATAMLPGLTSPHQLYWD